MNDICTCPICFLPYDQVTPVVASCGHSICRDCSITIGCNGSYTCPFCERESVLPLPKNLELINLLEFLHLQLDISTPKKISCLEPKDVPNISTEEILLQEEASVLYDTKFKDIPVIMKSCLYANKLHYNMEVAILKRLCHPNIIPLLAYSHSPADDTGPNTVDTCLIFEHAPNGKLSTYFHSNAKSEVGPKLLTKECRLKIAIDVVKALLYIQSQRKDIHNTLQMSFGLSLPMVGQKVIMSRHVLLDQNHQAKLMLMPDTVPDYTITTESKTATINSMSMGTDDTDDDASDKSVCQYQDNILEVKSIGYFLLELLFNQPMESFASQLSISPKCDMDTCILRENPILSQYSSEGGVCDNAKITTLFTQPLFSLAMKCLDDDTCMLCPLSTRQVLLQLLHIRKNLEAATTPPETPPSPSKQLKSQNPKKKVSQHKNKKESGKVSAAPSASSPPATTSSEQTKLTKPPKPGKHIKQSKPPLPRKNKRKTSHHPGYYNAKPYQNADGQLVPPSWRCCGRPSEKAMGCIYDTPSHHPGKWLSHGESSSNSSESRKEVILGVFDCCSGQDQLGGGCTPGQQPKPFRNEKIY